MMFTEYPWTEAAALMAARKSATKSLEDIVDASGICQALAKRIRENPEGRLAPLVKSKIDDDGYQPAVGRHVSEPIVDAI
jgi:hypothetical protein